MTPRIVGVAGTIGSGKDAILMYLKSRYGVPFIAMGDFARTIAGEKGILPTRDNLETISKQCFIGLGDGCFARMAAEEIKKHGWQVAGISGVRTTADVHALKKIFGCDFILLRVVVKDTELRFRRIRQRHEARDSEKFEDFQLQDRSEEEIFQISETASMADLSVSNDGTLEDLHRQIDKLVAEKKLPGKTPNYNI